MRLKSLISKIFIIVVGVIVIFEVRGLNIMTDIDNAVQYIQKIILTPTGGEDSSGKVIFEGSGYGYVENGLGVGIRNTGGSVLKVSGDMEILDQIRSLLDPFTYLYMGDGVMKIFVNSGGGGSVNTVYMDSGNVVINNNQEVVNFAVRSVIDPYSLFVDGGLGRVGINTSTPAYDLDVNGDVKVRGNLLLSKGGGVNEITGEITVGANNFSLPTSLAVKNYVEGKGYLTSESDPIFMSHSGDYYTKSESDSRYLSSESDPKVGSLTNNYIPKWGGSSLVDSVIYESNGKVGINTSTPQYALDVNGGAMFSNQLIIDLSGGSSAYPKRITSAGLGGSATLEFQTYDYSSGKLKTRLLLRGAGSHSIELYDRYEHQFVIFDGATDRVGINTSTPAYDLDVNGDIGIENGNNLYLKSSTRLLKIGYDNGYHSIGTTDNTFIIEKIDSNGNYLDCNSNPNNCIGTIWINARNVVNKGSVSIGGNFTPSYTLHVAGTGYFSKAVYAEAFHYNSDIRLKTGLQVITGALDKIMKLTGYYFSRKSNPKSKNLGVIAQQVQKVFPEAVGETKGSGGYLTVEYGNLVAPLIEAVKELKREIENNSCDKKLSEYQKQIKELEKKIDYLSGNMQKIIQQEVQKQIKEYLKSNKLVTSKKSLFSRLFHNF